MPPRSSARFEDETAAIAPLSGEEWIAIARALDAVGEAADDETALGRIVELLLVHCESRRGALGYLDEFGEITLPFEIGFGTVPSLELLATSIEPEKWEGAWGSALRERTVQVRNQAATEWRSTRFHGLREIAAPITAKNQVIGLLYATDKATDYDELDRVRIGLIARRAAPLLSAWLLRRRFTRDLADAEQMAAAATEGERFFMMSRDLMAIADTRIRRTNPAFWNLLGWEDHELRDKSIADLTHPRDRALLDRGFSEMRTEPNREHTPVRVQMVSKNGETRQIEWVGAATEEGRVYAVGRDVSALTQAVETLAIQNEELQRLQDQARAEEQLAGSLLANVRRQGCLDAPGIRHIASPLGFFNGDVALAAVTPAGDLRWMLGDFTGHGLSAAIGTIPVAGAFYAACRQGASLEEAISSINDLLKSLLPAGLFCAAGFFSLNHANDTLQIWNSALPPILLRLASGQVVNYPSQSLPLGLVDSRDLGLQPTQLAVTSGDDVITFTDGLSEASNAAGDLFGTERVAAALGSAARPGEGFDAILSAPATLRGSIRANDDVSLVSISVGHTHIGAGPGPAVRR